MHRLQGRRLHPDAGLLTLAVPPPGLAREQWGRLPGRVQDAVVKHARRGEPYPDRDVAALAVGWARAVLGPPGQRTRPSVSSAVVAFLSAFFAGGGGPTIYNGDREWDGLPAVRKAAALVEAVNDPPGPRPS